MIRLLSASSLLLIVSCNNPQNHEESSERTDRDTVILRDTIIQHVRDTVVFIDTFKRITPDEFNISDKMMEGHGLPNTHEIRVGEVVSMDMAWFRNDALKQVLTVGMYTDGFRTSYEVFYYHDIPSELLQDMLGNDGEFATEIQAKKAMRGFIDQSRPIGKEYFVSAKRFKLGDSCREKALKAYGKPDSIKKKAKYEIYYWGFNGGNWTIPDMKNTKPLAKNSYGYTVTMFFKKDKLFAMTLSNEVP
jgi:hypothetical protein